MIDDNKQDNLKKQKLGIQKYITVFLIGLIFLFSSQTEISAGQYTSEDILNIASGIINWKKSDTQVSSDQPLLNNTFLQLAGTTPGDWYPIGLSRIGEQDDYEAYLAVLKDVVEQRYAQSGKLSSVKATEWHRISLAILAAGGDPTDFGTDASGNPINLIADGTYNRSKTMSLGRQGINGWIWGLITVDSLRYQIPEDASDTREKMITEILRQQLADGGFAMSGDTSDPDITAMAMQALSPYDSDDKEYTYTSKTTGTEEKKSVHQVIDEALQCLSKLQLDTGDYKSWGTQNVESTAQTAVALCSLGIDLQTDERFIKHGNNLIDGMLRYRMQDGGFVHSYTYDADNPSSLPNQSNSMAGEQVLYTMAAIYRQMNGMRSLYDFRPEEGLVNAESDSISKSFSQEDRTTVDQLPDPLTTEQYVEVTKLLEKIQMYGISDNLEKSQKDIYLAKLSEAKQKIEDIQNEIDSINEDIMNQLYPFKKMNLSDKKMIDRIVKRYQNLSTYDQSKIKRWEDVIKTKTKVDNELRAIIILVVLVFAVLTVGTYLIRRIKKRRRKKQDDMQELYDKYQDE